jgi:hypothetical protein
VLKSTKHEVLCVSYLASHNVDSSTHLVSSKFTRFLVALLLPAALSHDIQTAENILTCDTTNRGSIYSCLINGQSLPDCDDRNVTVVMNHWVNLNDDSVQQLLYFCGNQIPFIVKEFFVKFANMLQVSIQCSGLLRIRSNDFESAANLKNLIIEFSPLHSIESNAFLGAFSLEELDLRFNEIQFIQEDSFDGLVSLRTFMLENNAIRHIPRNLFRSMVNLKAVFLSNNLIETLDGRLFANSPRLSFIDFLGNRIIEIGDEIVDQLDDLEFFNLVRNRCADEFFAVTDETSKDEIRQGLSECFDNFNSVKRSNVEIRGRITISDDYDNKIVSFGEKN